jgi:hypothetical protein
LNEKIFDIITEVDFERNQKIVRESYQLESQMYQQQQSMQGDEFDGSASQSYIDNNPIRENVVDILESLYNRRIYTVHRLDLETSGITLSRVCVTRLRTIPIRHSFICKNR